MEKKDNKELLKTYKEIAAILSEKNANTSNTNPSIESEIDKRINQINMNVYGEESPRTIRK